jgi:predicted dehydrogenase
MKTRVTRVNFMNRRVFLASGIGAVGAVWSGARPAIGAGISPQRTYRAAIIGRTGGGDYGHGYDQIFNGIENVQVEAIADPDATGRGKAALRALARRQYADYREMLRTEKPDLVCIAPRQPDCHLAMALAALETGASLFLEKPMTENLDEADRMVTVAAEKGAQIAVAHTRRYQSGFHTVKALLEEGLIGIVREVRIQGKQDQRSGGEDLLVLGTHDFDLMRFYFGDPLWCFATVTVGGRDATRQDIHRGQEPLWVAGDTIHACFGFPHNLEVHWSSVRTSDHWNTNFSKQEKWAFEIYGTRGIIAYQSGLEFAWLNAPFLAQKDGQTTWKDLPLPQGNRLAEPSVAPIRDLIRARETRTPPLCSGEDGRWAIEMVAAVYRSHFAQARVSFPLAQRTNPLL